MPKRRRAEGSCNDRIDFLLLLKCLDIFTNLGQGQVTQGFVTNLDQATVRILLHQVNVFVETWQEWLVLRLSEKNFVATGILENTADVSRSKKRELPRLAVGLQSWVNHFRMKTCFDYHFPNDKGIELKGLGSLGGFNVFDPLKGWCSHENRCHVAEATWVPWDLKICLRRPKRESKALWRSVGPTYAWKGNGRSLGPVCFA